MALPLAPYIAAAGIATTDLTFLWDEWSLRGYYDHDAYDRWGRLDELTIRAQLALAFATGEWICHRFSAVDRDPDPRMRLEAAWAGVVHPAYVQMGDPPEVEWRGPARGPLYIEMLIVADAFNHLSEDPDGANRATWMFNLAMHVLPSTDTFQRWFEDVVARLEKHHRKVAGGAKVDDDELFSGLPAGMGAPVPREAFDPAVPYDPVASPAQLDAFLQRLDCKSNPYLVPPDELEDSDFVFEGTPYRYP